MSENCPIVPNEAIRFNFGESEEESFIVAASHDSVQMFSDPRYTHLRYFDGQEGELRILWLPEEVIAQLVEMGIPVTIRESITETEHECYQTYLGKVSTAQIVEIDPIESEVERAHQHFDAELDYFLKEWE